MAHVRELTFLSASTLDPLTLPPSTCIHKLNLALFAGFWYTMALTVCCRLLQYYLHFLQEELTIYFPMQQFQLIRLGEQQHVQLRNTAKKRGLDPE